MSLKRRYHLFTILSVLVVSLGGILTWRGFAQGTIIPAGSDDFNTPGDGTSNETWNLPAGFFPHVPAATSNAIVDLRASFGGDNSACTTSDTVVCRPLALSVPGDTPIVLTQLKLVGTSFDGNPQLQVSFPGFPDVFYNVSVEQSEDPSFGTQHFNANGTSVIVDFKIKRKYKFTPSDTSQPIRCADSETEKLPDGTPVFGEFNLAGGLLNWFLVGNRCICFPNKHVDARLDDLGRPTHEHNAVQPLSTPRPTVSPSPTGSVTPKPTATAIKFGG